MGSSDCEKELVVHSDSPDFRVDDHREGGEGTQTKTVTDPNTTQKSVDQSEEELEEQGHQPSVSGLSQDFPLPVTGQTFTISQQNSHTQGLTHSPQVLESGSMSGNNHESLPSEEHPNKIPVQVNSTATPPSMDWLTSRVHNTETSGTITSPVVQTTSRKLAEASSSRQSSSVQQQPWLNSPPSQSPWMPSNPLNTPMPSSNLTYRPPNPWTTPPPFVSGFSPFWPPTNPAWTETQNHLYYLVHANFEQIDQRRITNHGAEILLPHPDVFGFFGDIHQTQLHPVFNGGLQLEMHPRQMVESLLGLFDHRVPLLEVPEELRHWILEESGDRTRQWRMFAALLEAKHYYKRGSS